MSDLKVCIQRHNSTPALLCEVGLLFEKRLKSIITYQAKTNREALLLAERQKKIKKRDNWGGKTLMIVIVRVAV